MGFDRELEMLLARDPADLKRRQLKRRREKAKDSAKHYRLARSMNLMKQVNLLLPFSDVEKFQKAAKLAREIHLKKLEGTGERVKPADIAEQEKKPEVYKTDAEIFDENFSYE